MAYSSSHISCFVCYMRHCICRGCRVVLDFIKDDLDHTRDEGYCRTSKQGHGVGVTTQAGASIMHYMCNITCKLRRRTPTALRMSMLHGNHVSTHLERACLAMLGMQIQHCSNVYWCKYTYDLVHALDVYLHIWKAMLTIILTIWSAFAWTQCKALTTRGSTCNIKGYFCGHEGCISHTLMFPYGIQSSNVHRLHKPTHMQTSAADLIAAYSSLNEVHKTRHPAPKCGCQSPNSAN